MISKVDFVESAENSLSIIIPTYNVEKYIAGCLESVLKQVPDDSVEILCVDDGSEDGTTELIKKYAGDYKNIRCQIKKHEGAWAARNVGISMATKKYLSFLDADDYYEEDAISKVYEACANSDEEVIGFAYWKILDNHDIREERIVEFSDDLIIPRNGRSFRASEWQFDYGYTNYVFKREFIEKNNIVFPPYMRYEDPVFLIKAIKKAKCFKLIPLSIYVCRVGYKDTSEFDRTIDDILKGIRDNLSVAYECGFEKLRKRLIDRIDDEFYEPIIRGLSDETMELLIEISKINSKFKNKREIWILQDIYKGNTGNRITERNYKREQEIIRDYRIFNDVSECMRKEGGFGRFLIDQGINTVSIYGAGLYGRLLVQDFLLHGIQVISVIDRNNDGFVEKVKITHPDGDFIECDLLIIALRNASPVVEDYRERGIHNVIGIQDLTDRMIRNQTNLFEEVTQ